MPQAGFDPPSQSDTSYEADALPPSHHGWILTLFTRDQNHDYQKNLEVTDHNRLLLYKLVKENCCKRFIQKI